MNYRAEIDGLRAIAVVPVILYHAEILIFGRDWFEGGFIGVDIFFVISGYLIIRIILTELEKTNKFSLIKFYERRARRILPMLLVIIAVSIPVAWQILLPSALVDFAKSALSAIGFGSNFFFYYSATEYGAESALLKPLLHTWSLSVEEQFYIFAPIIILVIWKFSRLSLLTIFIGALLLSIQFADVMANRNPQLNFFSPFTRFWELLIGASLAFTELKYGRVKNLIIKQTLPIFGLFLIAHGILFFDSNTPNPSFQTLIPVLGVALIIAFCSTDDLVGKLLSFKPIVGVGLISYSAYLWHFPIMAFARNQNDSPTVFDQLGWISLTFILSIISFYVVERPFRKKKVIGTKIFFWTISIFVSFLLIILTLISLNQAEKYRTHKQANIFSFVNDPWNTLKKKDGTICYEIQKEFCKFNKSGETSVFLIGDSTTAAFQSALKKELKNSEYSLTIMTSGACPFLIGPDKIKSNKIPDKRCRSNYQFHRLETILKDPKDKIVILAGALPLYFNLSYFDNPSVETKDNKYDRFFTVPGISKDTNIKALYEMNNREEYKKKVIRVYKKTIQLLLDNNIKVILVRPFPEPGFMVSRFLKSKLNFTNGNENKILHQSSLLTRYDINLYYKRNSFVDEILNDLNNDNLVDLDFADNFCDKHHCFTHNENELLFIDKMHQSEKISEKIAKRIKKNF